MSQISYAQALKNGLKRESDKKTLNGLQMLDRLEHYYGGSDTFFAKGNGILSKIMQYRFNSCLGCKEFLEGENIVCKKNIVCKSCLVEKTIRVNNSIYVLCEDCGDYHNSTTFEIECQICKKDSKQIFNINGTDVCRKCLNLNEGESDDYANSLDEVD